MVKRNTSSKILCQLDLSPVISVSERALAAVGPEPPGAKAHLNSLEKRDKHERSFLIEKLSQAVHSASLRMESI